MELNSVCLYPISTQRRNKFRHAVHMEAWAIRLNEVWRRAGWSKVELARRSDVPIDSVYKYLAGRVKQPRGQNLDKIADALGVARLWLREGIGPQFTKLPIVGYISAGEAIIFADDYAPGGGYGEIDFDLGGADPVVIEIRGDSMRPAYRPGDRIICSRMRGEDIDSCIRRDCAVKTLAGETYLKVLLRGDEDGTFGLESYNHAYPLIENAKLQWAAPVVWVRRS